MLNKAALSICIVALSAILIGCSTSTTRVGQTATVQFGVVRSAEPVLLDSAAAQGALVGGTLGMMAGSSNSTAANAIRGATFGGAARAASEGDRSGWAYTVDVVDGSQTRIVTDQREIRPGDCVAIEQVGGTSNIRRVSEGYCDVANRQAVAAVSPFVQSEAVECQSAKQELASATTAASADLAVRKVQLLCNG